MSAENVGKVALSENNVHACSRLLVPQGKVGVAYLREQLNSVMSLVGVK